MENRWMTWWRSLWTSRADITGQAGAKPGSASGYVGAESLRTNPCKPGHRQAVDARQYQTSESTASRSEQRCVFGPPTYGPHKARWNETGGKGLISRSLNQFTDGVEIPAGSSVLLHDLITGVSARQGSHPLALTPRTLDDTNRHRAAPTPAGRRTPPSWQRN